MVSDPVTAETWSVKTDGIAHIQGNQVIARDSAIKDAQRKAVEQAVGTLVSSETVVENSELVRDAIYSKCNGYIKQYSIVKESPDKDLYLITINAIVGLSDLKNDLSALGLLHIRVGKPRTLIMIAEQHPGQTSPVILPAGAPGAAETAIKEDFLAKEFNVIDRTAALSGAGFSDAAAREAGRMAGAELLIRGTAQVREAPRTPGSSVGSYLADVSATAVRIDNGQVLASGRGQGSARHIAQNIGENSALSKSGHDVAGKLIDQIIAKWIGETSGVQLTQITIRGLKDAKELLKIRELIAGNIRGVHQVIQRSYKAGVAILDVSAPSNAQQLGDELLALKKTGTGLEIVAVTAHTLDIAIVTAPAGK